MVAKSKFVFLPYVPVRHNPEKVLSPDQQQAVSAIASRIREHIKKEKPDRHLTLVLTGPAGTGKTTIVDAVVKELAQDAVFTYAAPTGKAAVRLAEVLQAPTTTVHSLIYGEPTELGQCPNCEEYSTELAFSKKEAKDHGGYKCPKCNKTFPLETNFHKKLGFSDIKKESFGSTDKGPRPVVIVDESSMIGPGIYEDLLRATPPKVPILFVGDREQLEPVLSSEERNLYPGKTWGPDFENPTQTLTKIHRQAEGSPIINLATRVRLKQNEENPLQVDPQFRDSKQLVTRTVRIHDVAAWLAEKRKQRQDATVLAFTNKECAEINNTTRRLLGLDAQSHQKNVACVRSDRLLVLRNSSEYKKMNGEVLIVNASRKGPDIEGYATTWVQFIDSYQWALTFNALYGVVEQKDKQNIYQDIRYAIGPALGRWQGYVKRIAQSSSDGRLSAEDPSYLHAMQDASMFDSHAYANLGLSGKDSKKTIEMYDKMATMHSAPDATEKIYQDTGMLSSNLLWVDYGQCLTVHKSQGSQWNYVGVALGGAFWYSWNDPSRRDGMRRWLYTAVTRASKELYLFRVVK